MSAIVKEHEVPHGLYCISQAVVTGSRTVESFREATCKRDAAGGIFEYSCQEACSYVLPPAQDVQHSEICPCAVPPAQNVKNLEFTSTLISFRANNDHKARH